MARVLVPADVALAEKKPARAREPRVLVLEVASAIAELPKEGPQHYGATHVRDHLPRLTQLRGVVRASGPEATEAVRAWIREMQPSPSITVRATLAYVLSDRDEAAEVLRRARGTITPPSAAALVLADAEDPALVADAGGWIAKSHARDVLDRAPHVLARFADRPEAAAVIVLAWLAALDAQVKASSSYERRDASEAFGKMLDVVVCVGTPEVAAHVATLVGKAGTREDVARYFKRFPELAENALRPLAKGRGKVRDAAAAMLHGLSPAITKTEASPEIATAPERADAVDGPEILADPPWRRWASAGLLVIEEAPTPTFDLPPEATAKHDREAWCTKLPSIPRNAIFSSRAAFPIAHAWLTSRAEREAAEGWLVTFAPIAIYGLLPFALGEPGPSRTRATSALRFVCSRIAPDRGPKVIERWIDDTGGGRALLAPAITAILEADARWDCPSAPPGWPSWLAVDALPPVRTKDGSTLRASSVRHLIELMNFAGAGVGGGDLSAEYVGVREVREALDPRSLGGLSLHVYQQWSVLGQNARVSWPLGQIALFGGRSAAHKLAATIRGLATDRELSRALEALTVLARLPDDSALVHLSTLAESAKNERVRNEARRLLDATAKQRGLEATELEDVLVPDLGMDDRGELWLDFGPRRVRVTLDACLVPVLRDETGTVLSQLPRANKSDDAEKAAAASELYKAVRADAEGAAKAQLRRFERAMCSGRAWSRMAWEERLLAHPVLRSLVGGLVWSATSSEGSVTFRVAEDRSLAGPDDEPIALPLETTIGLPHPLALAAPLRARWGTIFGDYELLQPFAQLSRETFELDETERASRELARIVGKRGEVGNLYALEQRGWIVSGSRTMVIGMRRKLGRGTVELRLEESVDLARPKETPEITALSLTVYGATAVEAASFALLTPIEASETLRDLAFLT